MIIKILLDHIPSVKVIFIDSSALDIHSKIKKPLSCQKWEYTMFLISWKEYVAHTHSLEAFSDLEHRLVFGMFPELFTQKQKSVDILKTLKVTYLFKDILENQGIKNPKILGYLLKALVLQVVAEVSFKELAQLHQIDRTTLEKYVDLLVKSFVVYKLQALNKNQRNEIKNSRKIYFFANGILINIINNFNPIGLKNNIGTQWVNFVISKRIKANAYSERYQNFYFWQNYYGQEVDYIKQYSSGLFTYEIKWNSKKKPKIPSNFSANHSNATFEVIHKEIFSEFVLD